MTSTTFFIIFVPILSLLLLFINLLLAPHNPYQEKDSVFECGFHSFLGQNRTQFSVSFFIFALLFLLFDLEILLVYPYSVSSYTNDIYGLIIMLIFFSLLTLGFIFELGKNALTIDSKQTSVSRKVDVLNFDVFNSLHLKSVLTLVPSEGTSRTSFIQQFAGMFYQNWHRTSSHDDTSGKFFFDKMAKDLHTSRFTEEERKYIYDSWDVQYNEDINRQYPIKMGEDLLSPCWRHGCNHEYRQQAMDNEIKRVMNIMHHDENIYAHELLVVGLSQEFFPITLRLLFLTWGYKNFISLYFYYHIGIFYIKLKTILKNNFTLLQVKFIKIISNKSSIIFIYLVTVIILGYIVLFLITGYYCYPEFITMYNLPIGLWTLLPG